MEEEVEVVNLEDRREKAEAKSNRKVTDLMCFYEYMRFIHLKSQS